MSSAMSTGSASTADLAFSGPTYFLGHLGMFGLEPMLIQEHRWPGHNAILEGAVLWDHDDSVQYFVTAAQLAGLARDDAATAPDPGPAFRSGILVHAPTYVLPSSEIARFERQSVLVKKHSRPERNAVLPGALIWDAAQEHQYFVFSNELVSLEQVLGTI